MGVSEFFEGLTGLMAVSIPIVWIVMHYAYRERKTSGFSEAESRQLQELLEIADSMADRIKNLESILDTEVPEWRSQHDKT
jgi:phage shock protein B